MSEGAINAGMSGEGGEVNLERHAIGATSVVGAVGVGGAAVPFASGRRAPRRAPGAPVKIDVSKLGPGGILVPFLNGAGSHLRREAHRRGPERARGTRRPLADRVRSPRAAAKLRCKRVACARGSQGYLRTRRYLYAPGLLAGSTAKSGLSPSMPSGRWLLLPCHGSKFDLSGRVYMSVPAPSIWKCRPTCSSPRA